MIKKDEEIDDLELDGLKIIQNNKWFKFGIDSVLLSDFAKGIKRGSKVLDIGCGSGILCILLSKKTDNCFFTGIEVQSEVADMAKRSVELNNLGEKINIINDNIKNLPTHYDNSYFDAIVTNPPYIKENTGKENENMSKYIARHEVECTLEDVIENSYRVLKNKGEFYIVYRPDRLVDLFSLMRKYKIEPKIVRIIYSKVGENSNLVLVKGIKNAKCSLKVLNPLIIYNNDGAYSREILKIYKKE